MSGVDASPELRGGAGDGGVRQKGEEEAEGQSGYGPG